MYAGHFLRGRRELAEQRAKDRGEKREECLLIDRPNAVSVLRSIRVIEMCVH